MTIRISSALLKLTGLALLVDELKEFNQEDLSVMANPIPDHETPGAFQFQLISPVLSLVPLIKGRASTYYNLKVVDMTFRRSGGNDIADFVLVDTSQVVPKGPITDLRELKERRSSFFHIMDRFYGGEELHAQFALADLHGIVALNGTSQQKHVVGQLIGEIISDIDKEIERIQDQMNTL